MKRRTILILGASALVGGSGLFSFSPVGYSQSQTVDPLSNTQSLIQLNSLVRTGSVNRSPVVTAMDVSTDGQWLVAAGDDHVIRIIQLPFGETIHTLSGHTDWVRSLAISDDRKLIVSGSHDGSVRVWRSGETWTSKKLDQSHLAVQAIVMDPTQTIVACAGFENSIKVFEIESGKLLATLWSNCDDQRTLAFSPDGQFLAAGGRDGILRVWNWKSNTDPILQKASHRGRIRTLRVSSDNWISSIGEDRHLIRTHLTTGEVAFRKQIQGGKLLSLVEVDEHLVAIAGADNTIRLYDHQLGTEKSRLIGHEGSVAVMVNHGSYLLSGSFDTTIRVWDLRKTLASPNSGRYEHPVSARFENSGATDDSAIQ